MVSMLGVFKNEEAKNCFFWEAMPEGSWRGRPAYIIGGGPSLEKHWPWLIPRLQGELTIGINRAFEKFDPTIIFGMDPTFIRWLQMGKYGELAKQAWERSRAYKVWLNVHNVKLPDDVYMLKCYGGYNNALGSFPLTMREGIGHGTNSGYAALNLAACLGASPIFLLGFDMKRDGQKTHWHNGHPRVMPEDQPVKFKKRFQIAAKTLAKANIAVINLNPDSALECFPKLDIESGFRPLDSSVRTEHIKRHPHIARAAAKYGGPRLQTLSEEEPEPKEKLPAVYIIGPYGFGDTIYMRSLIRSLARRHEEIYVRTTLPEAFWDIPNIKFVRPAPNRLHAQADHIRHIDKSREYKWTKPPAGIEQRPWGKLVPGWAHTSNAPDAKAVPLGPRGEESTTEYFVNEHGLKDFDFALPLKKRWLQAAKKIIEKLDTGKRNICLVRAPTIHEGWANYSRNPKPEYFQRLIDEYKDEYYFISAGYYLKDHEWPEKKLEGIDKRFEKGELDITTLFGLIKLSDMVIAPPDLFSVLAIALRTKCFCIFGGCAKPSVIFHPNMGLDGLACAEPEPFCNCMRMNHDCHKEISEEGLLRQFEELKARIRPVKRVSVGIPPGIGDMHWVLTMLESFKEKNGVDELAIHIDRNPELDYSRDFLKLVPFIDYVDAGRKRLPFKFAIAGGSGIPLQRNINGVDYLIEYNSRLEQGVRIEKILPEYEINFDYPIDYPREARSFAEIIKNGAGGKIYLFYASSMNGNKNWCKGTWSPKDWVELADRIHGATGHRIILAGAQWDSSYAAMIKSIDAKNNIQNLVGKTTIAEALGLLRESSFLVGFLSGLVVLATRFRIPCVSFWPTLQQAPHWIDPEKFQRSWLPPKAIEDGYMPFFYGAKETTPAGIFKALEKYL